jgi:hypothetical protein
MILLKAQGIRHDPSCISRKARDFSAAEPGLCLPHHAAAELRDRVHDDVSTGSYDAHALDKQISLNSVGR